MNSNKDLYPILFVPMYRKLCWGGTKFSDVLKRTLPDEKGLYAESWEICDREEANSVVFNGPLAGKTLHELMEQHGSALVGERFAGTCFPIMVKLLDVSQNTSMQVHPNAFAAKKIGNGAQQKTEMWYVLHAEQNARIWAGLTPSATRPHFLDTVNTPAIIDCVRSYAAMPGDAYFINAGRIHSTGAGSMLFEVSENSDTTYRVYDWGRVMSDGTQRELHIEQALECIDFMDRSPARVPAASNPSTINRKYALVNQCPSFSVDELHIIKDWPDSTYFTGSAQLLTAVNAPVKLRSHTNELIIPKSFTALLPACIGEYTICAGEIPLKVLRTVVL